MIHVLKFFLFQSWNDPSILTDNAANPNVQSLLRKSTRLISIVVRTDSSGLFLSPLCFMFYDKLSPISIFLSFLSIFF